MFFDNLSDIQVVLIGTNNKNAFIVTRAKKLKIPIVVFSKLELNNFDDLYKKVHNIGHSDIVEKDPFYEMWTQVTMKNYHELQRSFLSHSHFDLD